MLLGFLAPLQPSNTNILGLQSHLPIYYLTFAAVLLLNCSTYVIAETELRKNSIGMRSEWVSNAKGNGEKAWAPDPENLLKVQRPPNQGESLNTTGKQGQRY